jgi:hypothetical protein
MKFFKRALPLAAFISVVSIAIASDHAAAAEPKTPATKIAANSDAVLPKAIDPKYAKETPGRSRMHTCRDQYRANKATNGNGGLKWIMKGGGYYSLCNKALKS